LQLTVGGAGLLLALLGLRDGRARGCRGAAGWAVGRAGAGGIHCGPAPTIADIASVIHRGVVHVSVSLSCACSHRARTRRLRGGQGGRVHRLWRQWGHEGGLRGGPQGAQLVECGWRWQRRLPKLRQRSRLVEVRVAMHVRRLWRQWGHEGGWRWQRRLHKLRQRSRLVEVRVALHVHVDRSNGCRHVSRRHLSCGHNGYLGDEGSGGGDGSSGSGGGDGSGSSGGGRRQRR
jgi:hypothetical protein